MLGSNPNFTGQTDRLPHLGYQQLYVYGSISSNWP